MENNFIFKNNVNQKKNNFGVNFTENKEKMKNSINEVLALLNFFEKKSDVLGIYEVTNANLNDRQTFECAYGFLQIFDIDHKYRQKNSLFEYWVCNRTILRKKLTENDLNTQICQFCHKKNSKFRDTCWNCRTPF